MIGSAEVESPPGSEGAREEVGGPPPTGRTGRGFAWGVAAAYAALGLAFYWPILPEFSSHLYGSGESADPVLAMWFFAWVPHSLVHGLNPLFTHALFAPYGLNLAQNTEGPFLGLLTAPFAPFLGPAARSNLLMVTAMPLSAFSAFYVLRRWQVWAPGAAVGGLIFGFSPYAIGQSLGHPVLLFIPLLPLIALVLVELVQERGSQARLGTLLGLLMAAQFLAEPELMTDAGVIMLWGLACAAIRYHSVALATARRVWKGLAYSAVVAGVLLAYPVWMMTRGPQVYVGTAQPKLNPFYNDLFDFVVPGVLQRYTFGLSSVRAHLVLPGGAESPGYIGVPLLLVAGYLVWRSRSSVRMQLAAATTLGALLFSMGDRLVVDGHVTVIRLPFAVMAHLPLVANALPVRFNLELFACVGCVVGFGLDDIRRAHVPAHAARHRSRRSAAVLVAVLAVAATIVWFPAWTHPTRPATTLPAPIARAVPSGTPVAVTYPYASQFFPQAMIWQAAADFSFSLTGGYAEHPDRAGNPSLIPDPFDPPVLDTFLNAQAGWPGFVVQPVSPALVAGTRTDLARYQVRVVIVDRSFVGAGPVMDLFTQALGPPQVTSGSFALWTTDRAHL